MSFWNQKNVFGGAFNPEQQAINLAFGGAVMVYDKATAKKRRKGDASNKQHRTSHKAQEMRTLKGPRKIRQHRKPRKHALAVSVKAVPVKAQSDAGCVIL